jgi:hypothetical protein
MTRCKCKGSGSLSHSIHNKYKDYYDERSTIYPSQNAPYNAYKSHNCFKDISISLIETAIHRDRHTLGQLPHLHFSGSNRTTTKTHAPIRLQLSSDTHGDTSL